MCVEHHATVGVYQVLVLLCISCIHTRSYLDQFNPAREEINTKLKMLKIVKLGDSNNCHQIAVHGFAKRCFVFYCWVIDDDTQVLTVGLYLFASVNISH